MLLNSATVSISEQEKPNPTKTNCNNILYFLHISSITFYRMLMLRSCQTSNLFALHKQQRNGNFSHSFITATGSFAYRLFAGKKKFPSNVNLRTCTYFMYVCVCDCVHMCYFCCSYCFLNYLGPFNKCAHVFNYAPNQFRFKALLFAPHFRFHSNILISASRSQWILCSYALDQCQYHAP